MSRVLLFAAALSACAAPTPAPTSAGEPPTRSKAGEPAPAASPTGSATDVPPELPTAPPVTDPGWDFHAWAYARELRLELVSDGCEAAQLGDKPDETVWCAHHVEGKEGSVLYSRALYVARNKKLVKLVEIPIAAGVVDNPEKPRDEKDRQVIRFEITRAPDGKSVRLEPAKGLHCEDARKGNAEPPPLGPALSKNIERVCSARGTWKWAAGTLRQDR
ncbi:MAG: hypothetical protein IT377_12940 [Polyangiaceae bacterium]|nr:hypothetical protein [Polyangiaceae bacterium]